MPRAAASAATDAGDDPLGVKAVALPDAGVASAGLVRAEAEEDEPGGTADELDSGAVPYTPPTAAPVVPAAAAA